MTPASLCVSIHDVAPTTWLACEKLLRAVREVADIPVTLLVVPYYHYRCEALPSWYAAALRERLAAGDELALHGYTHVDEGAPAQTVGQRLVREVCTRGEGEFAALSCEDARQRLTRGRDWFARQGLPVVGFVAPAWLLSRGAWAALRSQPFLYTTTWRAFHLLPAGPDAHSPALVCAARNAFTRRASRIANRTLVCHVRGRPLARLGLHPADAAYADLTRHWQRLLAMLLEERVAMTKAQFTRAWHG